MPNPTAPPVPAAHIARSLDAPTTLLPHLPRLLQDLSALGSSPRLIASMLRGAGATRRWRILDVGCGKGAVAVQLARDLGCRVHGFDAFPPFIESARDLARRRGVHRRCTFEFADLRRVPHKQPFDAALMIGVRPLGDAVPLLRRLVRPGGLYVIDDAVKLGRLPPDAHALTPEQADALIAKAGDHVLARRLLTPSSIRATNQRIYTRLAARAKQLAADHPRLRPALHEFLRRQRRSNRLLAGPLRPCLWIVQRSP